VRRDARSPPPPGRPAEDTRPFLSGVCRSSTCPSGDRAASPLQNPLPQHGRPERGVELPAHSGASPRTLAPASVQRRSAVPGGGSRSFGRVRLSRGGAVPPAGVTRLVGRCRPTSVQVKRNRSPLFGRERPGLFLCSSGWTQGASLHKLSWGSARRFRFPHVDHCLVVGPGRRCRRGGTAASWSCLSHLRGLACPPLPVGR
jgi:hypothetical protein